MAGDLSTSRVPLRWLIAVLLSVGAVGGFMWKLRDDVVLKSDFKDEMASTRDVIRSELATTRDLLYVKFNDLERRVSGLENGNAAINDLRERVRVLEAKQQ